MYYGWTLQFLKWIFCVDVRHLWGLFPLKPPPLWATNGSHGANQIELKKIRHTIKTRTKIQFLKFSLTESKISVRISMVKVDGRWTVNWFFFGSLWLQFFWNNEQRTVLVWCVRVNILATVSSQAMQLRFTEKHGVCNRLALDYSKFNYIIQRSFCIIIDIWCHINNKPPALPLRACSLFSSVPIRTAVIFCYCCHCCCVCCCCYVLVRMLLW